MSFIHLNVHSDYSRGWGVGTITELCQAAKDLGIKRFALTDTNGLYGLVFFVQIAKEMGIVPIFGSELLHDGQRAVLIVKNREGYANLCHIISARHCHHDFDLIRALRERRRGLIIFSDDFSLLTALKRDSTEDLFVEMSPGYQMGRCYAFSRKTGTPPLATNRVYMVHKGQFRLHRILRAVSLNTKLSRLTGEEDICREHNFLNAPNDMVDQYPHAPAAISNTVKVAEAALSDWDFDRLIFPSFENLDAAEAFNELYRATMDGCRERYGRITPQVRERVEHEMQIIRKKRFAPYFLVVADITKKARRSCGRGSSAASIVSYALGITHVDPIKHHLFFERFLNPGRMDPPDIDVDFAWDERDQVIDDAFAKYGPRRTAMVANHNTLGPRSAIREVAKVFGLTDREIGQVTGNIGFGWRLKAAWQELARHPKMRGIKFHKPWDEILTAAFQLQGHFNHLSTHCGGVVIVPDEIRRYCPVEISSSGLQVLQWEKDSVEEAGLVKIDILGNLSDIKYTGKGWHIRVGFMQLKGLSHEAKEGIIHERIKNGPFISLEDFLGRTGPHLHLQDVRILIKGGCFDGIARGASRPRLIWEALRFFSREEEKTAPGLFAPTNTTVPLPGVTYRNTSYPRHVMLRHESEVFGFILSVHPLAIYGDILKGLNYVRAKDLHSWIGREVTTVGWPVTGKTVHTHKGESMKFITFEDLSAAYEAVFFPEVYHRFCHMLNATRPYILKGRVEETFGAINITVTKVGFLDRGKTKPTFLADFT